ncbi:MAG: L-type lectin-domain containing protein [Bacteroidota bacterium]
MKKLAALILMGILGQTASAQYVMLGTALRMGNGCIQLTPDVPYSEGLAYNTEKLDLSRNFQIDFDLYLGDKEEGADGITFVIHNDVRQFDAFGTWGECMGYGRWDPSYPGNSIDPSIAVEFDTYQNWRQNDPPSDHVAFLENGSSRHKVYWNGGNDAYDLEDAFLHNFNFRWDKDEQVVKVYLDGNIVYEGKHNLVEDIFEGETKVIWGFTASTGRASNHQYFCLKRMAMLGE